MRVLTLIICLALAMFSKALSFAGDDSYLVVSGEEPRRELVCLPIEPGMSFSLEFINSIYLAPVRETFIYDPKEGMILISVESPSAGVFEYYRLSPEQPGKASVRRSTREIPVRSYSYENHRLTVGERRLSFNEIASSGELLRIWVRTGGSCEAKTTSGRSSTSAR
jgi:hypothetical protein